MMLLDAKYPYPGVYIEEEFNLSMSIMAGATAVPVIACRPLPKPETPDEKESPRAPAVPGDNVPVPLRVNSWLDWLEFVEQKPDLDFRHAFHAGMRAYFENGGGYCYVLSADCFEAQVPLLDDVTLLVAGGEDISAAVGSLCGPGKGLFAILDYKKDGELTVPRPGTDTDLCNEPS